MQYAVYILYQATYVHSSESDDSGSVWVTDSLGNGVINIEAKQVETAKLEGVTEWN